ncbi:nitrate reductase [Oscillatoria laete-virens NRMC-F 0139]|nr:nitrate reductase [Oscillatoria laete-virens]MDL5052136.1 nitrate reductase [Oscillatoria laete-virens NRMC-F 0139]
MNDITKTLCPYCGVGCGLEVLPPAQRGKATKRDDLGNPIWQVRGDRSHPSSQGMVCVKGATIAESLDKDRLLYPMIRESLDRPFRRASWDEALDLIVTRLQAVQQQLGPQGICMYGSGQLQTEDYYIAQKLLKGFLKTNNFDSNSRLCMSSAVVGYQQSLGSDGPPCCYEDLEQTDFAFLIGTNAAECHPIAFNRLRKYHKRNPRVKMVVVDPRRTATAEAADLHLAIKPGTDIDLLNGIAYLLMQWGAIHAPFIDECTSHFPEFAQLISEYTPERVAQRCDIPLDSLEEVARYWAESEKTISLWSMGMNQSSEGTAKVRSLINLHLMTGTIGKPGCGPFSLTGQPNAMGGREAGGLSSLLPGYRSVKNSVHRAEVEAFWGLPPGQISPEPGYTAGEMVQALETGGIGLLWVVATNPAVSLPDLERAKAALARSPFTIVQDAYYPTETTEFAHVLLPAAQWGEKTGTMTNSERVVTLCQAFRPPKGEAKPDWEIFAEVARRLGFGDRFTYPNSAAVYAEYVQITQGRVCDLSGLSHELLADGPIQWPYGSLEKHFDPQPNREPNKRLYTHFRFPTPDGRARFGAYHSRGLAEPPDPDYPLVLTTGRLYGHWHTQTRTGRIEKIQQMYPQAFIEIHPRDALKLGVVENDWVDVQSRRGKSRFAVKVTKAIAPGTVFVPMHWGSLWAENAEANALTHSECCPDSSQPELKACAVQLSKVKSEFVEMGTVGSPSLIAKH